MPLTHPGTLPTFNKRGQQLGPKGLATRTAIMNATLALLRELPLWQINPSDIAVASDIQQSNFYTYFDNVEEVILALAARAAQEAPDHRLDAPAQISGAAGMQWIQRIVTDSIAEWLAYGPVLRIVEMLADNDVPEFREARRQRLNQLHDILVEQIRAAQAAGDLHPQMKGEFVSYSVLSLIRVTAEHYNLTRTYPMSNEDIVVTTTRMAHLMLTGRSADYDLAASAPVQKARKRAVL
jgi:AcrR family transcriptional regulator